MELLSILELNIFSFNQIWILISLVCYNIIAIIYVLFLNRKNKKSIFLTTLTVCCCMWIISIHAFQLCLKHQSDYFQLKYAISFLEQYGINFIVSIDNLSLCFLMLTTFIVPLCILSSYSISKNYKEFVIYLLLIELCLILSFIAHDLLIFYIFFESVLIPMFLIIGNWGARERKIKAAYYLFLYTLFGSFFLLIAIFWIYIWTGSTNFDIILHIDVFESIDNYLSIRYLWWFLFIPFAIKIPMFPFHIWLTEAHVEAPTIGSIILASLLLKLGGYGMIRVLFPLTHYTCWYNFMGHTLALCSIIFASFSTIRQIDLKRIIAYSSIAHMNVIVLGIFSLSRHSWDGSIYLMIGHAFVSSALFFLIGVLYDRHHTRLLKYFGGLVTTMPIFSTIFFILTLANMSFPGTSNFIGEFLIFLGIVTIPTLTQSFFLLMLAATSVVCSAIYSIWLFNRVNFGTLKIKFIDKYTDINYTEFIILTILLCLIIIFGINSDIILNSVNMLLFK